MPPRNLSPRALVAVKFVVFVACALPGFWLLHGALLNELGANPLETLLRGSGDWTLRMLLITLAVSPLRRLTGWLWLQALRRMLGLYAYAYACLHFLTWSWFDKGWNWAVMLADVLERPFITVGFLGFVLLLPLAVTSTRGMMRRLGRNWQRLHRAIYLVATLGVVHYVWLVKADWLEPAIYGALLGVLLALRLPRIRDSLLRWRAPNLSTT
jgi:sulfoxide reductase heme-binding subunit YedZ